MSELPPHAPASPEVAETEPRVGTFNLEALSPEHIMMLGRAVTEGYTAADAAWQASLDAKAGYDEVALMNSGFHITLAERAAREAADAAVDLEERFIADLAEWFSRDPLERLPFFMRQVYGPHPGDAATALRGGMRGLFAAYPEMVLGVVADVYHDDRLPAADIYSDALAPLMTPEQARWLAERTS